MAITEIGARSSVPSGTCSRKVFIAPPMVCRVDTDQVVSLLQLSELNLSLDPRLNTEGRLVETTCESPIQQKQAVAVRVEAALLGNGDLKVVDVVPQPDGVGKPLTSPAAEHISPSLPQNLPELVETIPVMRDGKRGKYGDKPIVVGKGNSSLNPDAILQSKTNLGNGIKPAVTAARNVTEEGLRPGNIGFADRESIVGRPLKPTAVGVHDSREKIGNGLRSLRTVTSPSIEPKDRRVWIYGSNSHKGLSPLEESPNLITGVDLIGAKTGDEGTGTKIGVYTQLGNREPKMLPALTVSHGHIGKNPVIIRCSSFVRSGNITSMVGRRLRSRKSIVEVGARSTHLLALKRKGTPTFE